MILKHLIIKVYLAKNNKFLQLDKVTNNNKTVDIVNYPIQVRIVIFKIHILLIKNLFNKQKIKTKDIIDFLFRIIFFLKTNNKGVNILKLEEILAS